MNTITASFLKKLNALEKRLDSFTRIEEETKGGTPRTYSLDVFSDLGRSVVLRLERERDECLEKISSCRSVIAEDKEEIRSLREELKKEKKLKQKHWRMIVILKKELRDLKAKERDSEILMAERWPADQ